MSTEDLPITISPTVQTYYNKHIATVIAIEGDIDYCRIPTEELMAFVDKVLYNLHTDLDELVANGLNRELAESLNERLGTFMVAASDALIARGLKGESMKKLYEAEPMIYELVETISEAIAFACRHDDDALISLENIKEGAGRKDSIYDLLSLYKLGDSKREKLESINFDTSKLDRALVEHTRLLNILTVAENTPSIIEEKQVIKDKAYVWLNEVLEEVDACARYTYGRKSDRYKQYQNDYWKRRAAKSKRGENTIL